MKLWRKRSSSRGAIGGWWTEGGATGAVAVYQPKGAASLAASYTDLSGNGNDAAPGVAPTWASGTGWTFNGTTQELLTGYTPANDQSHSFICRFYVTGSPSFDYVAGFYGDDPLTCGYLVNSTNLYAPANGSYYFSLSRNIAVDTTFCVAGNKSYTNGVDDGITIPAGTGAAFSRDFAIGSGSGVRHCPCVIVALAIYNTTLTADQVSAITAAMNAL